MGVNTKIMVFCDTTAQTTTRSLRKIHSHCHMVLYRKMQEVHF